MKNKPKLIPFLILMCTVLVMSCEEIEDGEYVNPVTLYEKVQGNWSLTDISQIDETAKIAGIMPDEMSLYSHFGFEEFKLALGVDENDEPTTYQVTGNAPELFPIEGYWELNNAFPASNGSASIIQLYTDAARTVPAGQLSIVTMPGANAEMELKLTRNAEGVPFVSYHYKLSKTN